MDQLGNELVDALAQLAELIKQAAPVVWEMARRQVMIEQVQWGVLSLASLITLIVLPSTAFTQPGVLRHSGYSAYDSR